ncbi:hypothetical protein SLEP1_g34985 [Rubroshorea leprosula]|uniref:Uncharacterized protein n=1 Tax=Rubroshorea leprosula TaxID=152421 RepID=A0AAV5KLT1_9ROSI|nr:hypothetical protein SLEP1_g34985 [Rubroshorea leprosula]
MLGVGSLFALISLFHILWIHRRFSKRCGLNYLKTVGIRPLSQACKGILP